MTVGSPDGKKDLSVFSCPKSIVTAEETEPQIGYLMLYPEADLGAANKAITLEVMTQYNGDGTTVMVTPKTVTISNITGGVKAGQSHLITLTFSISGEITAETGIAEWIPGNGGGSIVKP